MDRRVDGNTAAGLFGYLHPDLFRPLCGPTAFLFANLLEYLDTEVIGSTGKARKPGDVVVYTGGFPSRAVVAAIRALAAAHTGPVLH
jgi:hypothetical protein